MKITTIPKSTYKKLAVMWLKEALCFVSSSVLADSLGLRNPRHRKSAHRYLIILMRHLDTLVINQKEVIKT